MIRRVLAFAAVIATVIGVSWGTAFAGWLANAASGTGTSKALSMPAGPTPTAPATSSGSVTLTWTAATLAGSDLTAYTVRRYPAAGGAGTEIACASQTITNHVVSCTYTETAAGSYQFTTAAKHASWVGAEGTKSGTTVVTLTTARSFTVVPQAGNRTAGAAFTVSLTAITNGVVDTAYSGTRTIAFTGPNTALTGQKPTESASVVFTAGVGTTSITAYKAETFTLTATDASPARSGSASVTVVAGAQAKLAFSVACPGTTMATNSTWTSAVDILDQWSNPTVQGATSRNINLSSSANNNGSLGSSSVTVAANANPARSGTFTYTADKNVNKTTTITASVSANALTAATCQLGTAAN